MGGGYLIVPFEIELIATSYLSYRSEWLYYIIAYNIGIILFLIVKKTGSLCLKSAKWLGRMGFPFFLSAQASKIILEKLAYFDGTLPRIIIGYIAEFILTLLIAIIISRFIEKPFLKWANGFENKLVKL